MDIVLQSKKLRNLIKERMEQQGLSYGDIVEMARRDKVSLHKSNLSNYFRNYKQGKITQHALIWLALSLNIDIRMDVRFAESEKEVNLVKQKLLRIYGKSDNCKGEDNDGSNSQDLREGAS